MNRFEAESARLTAGASGDVAALSQQMFYLGALYLRRLQRAAPTVFDGMDEHLEALDQIDKELADCTPIEDGRRTHER